MTQKKQLSTASKTKKKANSAKAKAAAKDSLHRNRRLLLAYVALVAVSATIATSMALARHSETLADPFPAAQHQAVHISLYYPSRLPDGYQFDIASAESVEQTVVVLRATNPTSGQEFSISQQTAPKDFNYNILYNSFEGKTTFKTKLGIVTTGTIDNGQTRIASLVTKDNTWVLVNAKSDVPLHDLQVAFDNLHVSSQKN